MNSVWIYPFLTITHNFFMIKIFFCFWSFCRDISSGYHCPKWHKSHFHQILMFDSAEYVFCVEKTLVEILLMTLVRKMKMKWIQMVLDRPSHLLNLLCVYFGSTLLDSIRHRKCKAEIKKRKRKEKEFHFVWNSHKSKVKGVTMWCYIILLFF